ncbi:M12 family metallopeptidase [Niabella sp. CC-SYL272]|uniref:M12 family metallopeptidase n=1 Tax=Niabella agricola TaxID=2891571 RepID=UPI001F3AF142|nr:M12 family metallopeptidase [Niabella agricola]MCF3111122.1 M12 family metallopeptidase [Niabella agricola]
MKQVKMALLLLAATGAFTACQKSGVNEQKDEQPEAVAVIAPEFLNLKVCTELYPEGVSSRGATIKAKQWPNGTTLTVSLNGGTAFVRSKVIQFAKQWETYANIKFNFVTNDRKAPIRVTFSPGGSWSYIGTDAYAIKGGKATMNFGWFDNSTPDNEFSRVAIHEFGHALGMIHEHQHPLADIPWDRPKVYEYYKQTQGWTTQQVDVNIFQKYSTTETNYSAYDMASIMHYPVQEELTIGDFAVGWNTVLSSTDKSFIGTVYPK